MKVALWLAKSDTFGGYERRMLRILNELKSDSSLEIDIIVLRRNLTQIGEKRIESFFNDKEHIIYFNNQIEATKYILTHEYDWVCVADVTRRSILIGFLCRLTGKKMLFSSVDAKISTLMFSSVRMKVIYYLMVFLSKQIDCLYPSSALIHKSKFPHKIISTTPGSFTDMEKYNNVTAKSKQIVFASRLVRGKNVLLFLEAVLICIQELRNQKYKVLICGDGPLEEEAYSFIKKNKIDDVCSMVGFIDTSVVLPESLIFCSLQEINNYPSQSLIEAEASGCYCIVSDVGESALMIKESFGVLVPLEKGLISKEIIKGIYFDEKKREIIRNQSRKHVAHNFSLDNSAAYFRSIFC